MVQKLELLQQQKHRLPTHRASHFGCPAVKGLRVPTIDTGLASRRYRKRGHAALAHRVYLVVPIHDEPGQ